jgi:hypothetical protein
MDMVEKVTIDGTYADYTVVGDYNMNLKYMFTSESEYTATFNYDCAYVVSYQGKGMKVVATGDVTMASPSCDDTYNLHYAVYDNSNVRRYDYDFVYP